MQKRRMEENLRGFETPLEQVVVEPSHLSQNWIISPIWRWKQKNIWKHHL